MSAFIGFILGAATMYVVGRVITKAAVANGDVVITWIEKDASSLYDSVR